MYNMKKNEFASNCGAGSEGNEGFQEGNTCAGEGGGDYTPRFSDGSVPKSQLLGAYDSKGDDWDDLSGKEKKEARWLDHLRRKENENVEEVAREKAEIAKAEQEADDLYLDNRAWIKEQGTDSIASDIGNQLEELGFDISISGYEGESKYISVELDGEFIGDVRVADHSMPIGGGFNVEKGARHGEATVSIDPERGIDIDSAIERIVDEVGDRGFSITKNKDTGEDQWSTKYHSHLGEEEYEIFQTEATNDGARVRLTLDDGFDIRGERPYKEFNEDYRGTLSGWMDGIRTDEDKRRQGYAESLVKNSIEVLREKGAHRVLAYLENEASRSLFEKLGFERTGAKSRSVHKDLLYKLDLKEASKITHKRKFASNCGAGKEGNAGFQEGNTCAGEGGGEATATRKRVTKDDLTEVEAGLVGAIRDTAFTQGDEDTSLRSEDIVQALWGYRGDAIDLMLTEFEEVLYDDEGNDLIKWHTEGDDVVEKLKDYYYTLTQDWLKEKYPDTKSITVYRGDFVDSHGDYTSPQFVTTDISKAQKFAEGRVGDKVGERTVMSYEVSLEDILMCQECMPRSFEEEAFLVSPEALKIVLPLFPQHKGDGGGSPTSTPEFKSWFGDSKVVDDSGEPLVVYHGTNQDFDEFDTLKLGTNTGSYGFLGQGLYFTTEVSDAEKYGSSVMPVYVKSEKLLRLDDDIHKVAEYLPNLLMKDDKTTFKEASDVSKKFQSEAEVKKWKSGDFWEFSYTFDGKTEYGDSRLSDAQVENPKNLITFATRDYLRKNDIPNVDSMGALGNYFDSYSFTKAIIEGGFDGVRSAGTNFGDIGDEIMVFNPTQIKSAIGNTGSFDPNNPKITHKRKFAKKDAFDEMFDIFEVDLVESVFEAGVNQEALDDLFSRLPMKKETAIMMSMAKSIAEEIVVAERAGILPLMESSSKGVRAAIRKVFWVSDVDQSVVVNIQKLLGDAIRGVMPDETLDLPDFINKNELIKSKNITDARLETIYRTNLSTAANEGTMSVLRDPEAQDLFPLVMISEIVDDRSRPHHAAMDGYVTTPAEIDRLRLRPPNGYNCRGTLSEITWDEAEDEGLLDVNGKPDMIAIRRYNTPEQQALIASGQYPDEGFKYGGMM